MRKSKEAIKEYNRKYYQEHKEELMKKRREKGSNYKNYAEHYRNYMRNYMREKRRKEKEEKEKKDKNGKLNPGFENYVLSDREAAIICRVINIYDRSGDRRYRPMVERITRILNGSERDSEDE